MQSDTTSAIVRGNIVLGALLFVLAFPLLSSAGEHSEKLPGATVQELLELIRTQSPELAAMQQESDAAAARVQPAGALGDPSLRIEWQDIDRNNPSLLPGRVGAIKYTLLQPLPFWGKRELRREIAEAEASQADARTRFVEADLRSRIKTAFAQHYQAVHARILTAEILQLVRDLEQLARARYATGLAPQQDVIKAQLEQTALQSELIALETEKHHAQARLNTMLNRPAHAPLAEPRALRPLPQAASLDGDALGEKILHTNPMLFSQSAQISAAESGQRLAARNWYPDVTIGISPVQRESRLNNWEAMLELNIPLQIETRRSREREAAATASSERLRLQAISNQVMGEFRESLATLEAARNQENLLQASLLPQAELTFKSALAGYQTGKVDFATLLDAQRQIKKARLDHLKTRVEQQIRLSEIERLLGEDL